MKLVFSDTPYVFDDQENQSVTKSIFLAGPSPRYKAGDEVIPHWRHQALALLEELGYDGDVYIPSTEEEYTLGNIVKEDINYDHQFEWEQLALHRADVIFFYVARTEKFPGLTTNIEFGMFKNSGRVIYARPDTADSIRYLDLMAKKDGLEIYDLEGGLKAAIERIGEGALRTGLACKIPLLFWRSEQFQDWWIGLINQKNRLLAFEAKSVITLNKDTELFGFSAWVSIWIASEDREKSCEWIFSRTHATYVVPFYTNPDGSRSYVLVRDFRSTARNCLGYVYELPGGSHESDLDARENAVKELKEETGLDLSNVADRLIPMGIHQPYAIFAINVIIPYAVELNKGEIDLLLSKVKSGETLGEDNEEVIKLCIMNERSINGGEKEFPIDLMTMGLIRLSDAYCPRKQPVLPRFNIPRSSTL